MIACHICRQYWLDLINPVNENIRYMDEVCCGNWNVFLVDLLYVHPSVVVLFNTDNKRHDIYNINKETIQEDQTTVYVRVRIQSQVWFNSTYHGHSTMMPFHPRGSRHPDTIVVCTNNCRHNQCQCKELYIHCRYLRKVNQMIPELPSSSEFQKT